MTWTGQRERGSLLLLRLMFWIARAIGWRAGHALLLPITAYFYASSPKGRAVSRDYLRRVLGRNARPADVARHFYTFANVLLDRIFFLSGDYKNYVIDVHGVDSLEAVLARGKGCVLLGAHLGSFDMLRAFGKDAPVAVHPVMFRREPGVFTRLVEALDPDMASRVIDIGETGAMLKVQEAIERGEIVGFLGDRAPDRHRTIDVPFLDGQAAFPTGPLVLASLVRAPVVLFYGVRTGPRRYAVHFETFANAIELRRSTRDHDVRFWVQRYADSLAAACKVHPLNWFNFYPFWQDDGDEPTHH